MENTKLFGGYNPDFLLEDASAINSVPLPLVGQKHDNDIVCTEECPSGIFNYVNYSLIVSKTHKFAFFSACNIDGLNFKKVPRKDRWRKDPRLKNHQWGMELYGAANAKFDRGHMTKREDVQWGNTPSIAMTAAESTFFYPNAAPQHKALNRELWRSLEDYILNTETKKNSLRVCVFTGPVLDEANHYFLTPIKGLTMKIPTIFWKVVVYPKSNGELFRVGFLMSQKQLLLEDAIIEELESAGSDEDLLLTFKDAGTYQVNIQLIERLTGLTFPLCTDAYQDQRETKLVLKEVDIDPDLEGLSFDQQLGFVIENLTT